MLRRLADRLAAWPLVDLGLLALAAIVLVAAGGRAVSRAPSPLAGNDAVTEVPAWTTVPEALPQLSDDAALATLLSDPFRPDRKAPPERYRLLDAESRDSPAPGRAGDRRTPEYRLKGIAVSEGTRLALIEGSPARPGLRVYQLGDSIDFFLITDIAEDSVVLSGADTVIVAKMKRSWKK